MGILRSLGDVQVNDQADVQVKRLIFNNLNDVIAFSNQDSDQVGDQASDQAKAILSDEIHNKVGAVLGAVAYWISRAELFAHIGMMSNHSTNRRKYLDPLISLGWVEMEYPDKRTNPNQRYKITAAGSRILKLVSPE